MSEMTFEKIEIDMLQEAYEEALKLQQLAWKRVEAAMLADAPIKVGDLVDYTRYDNKVRTLLVSKVWVTRDFYGKPSWRVSAHMYPLKKDGTPVKVGVESSWVESSWDVMGDFRKGTLKLSTRTIADITGPVKANLKRN
jgi:hypothetical protein